MSFVTRNHMDATVTDLPLNQTFDFVRDHEEALYAGVILLQWRNSRHFEQLITKPGNVLLLNIASIEHIGGPVERATGKSPPSGI